MIKYTIWERLISRIYFAGYMYMIFGLKIAIKTLFKG